LNKLHKSLKLWKTFIHNTPTVPFKEMIKRPAPHH
jgi:hypothetical protein